MNKNNNIFAVIVGSLIVIIVALVVYGGKNKTGAPETVKAPAVDMHGHPLAANISAASLQDLVNKPAPDFTLADRDGKQYSLNELRGKNIVLFFNEGLMCYPACWNQITALAGDGHFKNDDTVVLSVVVDSSEEWQKAVAKMPELAKATVVFDKGAAVSKKFGVLTTASSMHYGSLPGHTYFIINKEGIVRYAFDDPKMGIRNNLLVAEIAKLSEPRTGAQ
ncbi:MAG: redoxin domain-containing protein [bacterium]|nr:redoxin domain-containing protein [bacterium]